MSKNKIIIIIVVVVAGILAYMYLTKGDSTSGLSLVAENKTAADFSDAKDILNLLNRMSQIKLDDSIFQDQGFESLKDTTVVLTDLPSGRNNPFAPLGSSGSVGSKTQVQTKKTNINTIPVSSDGFPTR